MAKQYIDENVNVLTGKDAEVALCGDGDLQFLTPDEGVVKVPRARWEKAQRCERKHWMERNLHTSSDRNYEHFHNFCNYEAVAGRDIGSALELGCGPFTNLQYIGDVCTIRECALLDPLIESYLDHPNCTYDRDGLWVRSTDPITNYFSALASKMSKGSIELSKFTKKRKIAVTELISKPIEEMEIKRKYDLVVMINVLEHCYNVDLIFDNILSSLREGGIFIFHDKLYGADQIKESLHERYDAAHPLKIDEQRISSYLDAHFIELFNKYDDSRSDDNGVGTWQYFIGRKKDCASCPAIGRGASAP